MKNIKSILLKNDPMSVFSPDAAMWATHLRNEVFHHVEYKIYERIFPLVFNPIVVEINNE